MWKAYLDLPRAVHILCLGTFINRAGSLVVPFMTLYLKEDRGFGAQFATWAIGVFGAGSLAGSLLGGHLADRIGRRAVMLIALLGGAAVILVFSTLTQQWSILLGLFAFALIADMYRPAAAAMVADLVEPARRPHAFGLIYVSINLGFAVGPIVAAELSQYSFSYLFWGDALTTSIYAIIIIAMIRETLPPRAGRLSPSDLPPGHDAPPDETAAAESRQSAVAHMVRNRPFVVFCLSVLLIGMIFHQCMSTLPLHLGHLELDRHYGWIIAINGMMITVLQLPLTAFLSRFHRLSVIAVGATLTGIGFGATVLATAHWHFALTVVIWTAGEMMQAPFGQSVVSDLAPARFRARYFGVLSMSFGGAMMIGPPLGGWTMTRFGAGTLWIACLITGLVAAALVLTLRRRIESAPTPERAEVT